MYSIESCTKKRYKNISRLGTGEDFICWSKICRVSKHTARNSLVINVLSIIRITEIYIYLCMLLCSLGVLRLLRSINWQITDKFRKGTRNRKCTSSFGSRQIGKRSNELKTDNILSTIKKWQSGMAVVVGLVRESVGAPSDSQQGELPYASCRLRSA